MTTDIIKHMTGRLIDAAEQKKHRQTNGQWIDGQTKSDKG